MKHINKYHPPSVSKRFNRSKNAVYLNRRNSFKHEIAKCVGGLMLSKFGDVKFDDELLDMLDVISIYLDYMFAGWPDVKHDFITEAVPNSEDNRRIDLVDVTDNVRFEFENKDIVKPDAPDGTQTVTICLKSKVLK